MRFEVLKAVTKNNATFMNVTPCILVDKHQICGGRAELNLYQKWLQHLTLSLRPATDEFKIYNTLAYMHTVQCTEVSITALATRLEEAERRI